MSAAASPPPFYLSLARLIRLPNVFTAPPDVLVGSCFLLSNRHWQSELLLAVVVSVMLYISGMIWNDWFDVEKDRRERPNRPLPSGAISMPIAFALAMSTMLVAIVIAWVLSFETGIIASMLALGIIFYDGLFKSWFFAPVIMGACRSLDVLLGASLESGTLENMNLLCLAVGVGVYISGVTLFARNEAGTSNRWVLVCATGIMVVGILFIASGWRHIDSVVMYLLAGLEIILLWIVLRPITTADSRDVQGSIKWLIFFLVVIHSISATRSGIPVMPIVVALHLVPAYLLGRWLYST